jgi:hypothetical protein
MAEADLLTAVETVVGGKNLSAALKQAAILVPD